MSQFDVMANATFGMESVVKRELLDLGFSEVHVEDGKVLFRCDEAGICRANLWLRSADRVRIQVGQFTAVTFDQLFEQTKALPWADWLPKQAAFPVQGKSVKSALFSVSDCQAIVKKAIVESMKQRYSQSWFSEDGPLFPVEVALRKDVVSLSLDTSGTGLHRRGYRTFVGEAPLRETLAAGLIQLSRWKPDIALIDPVCGSGVIPLEAALIGLNIAPGFGRSFACEQWPWIGPEHWEVERQAALTAVRPDRELHIIGTDIDESVIKVARRNAEQAKLGDTIHFQTMALQDVGSRRKYGKVICNPPYGERIGDVQALPHMYRQMKQTFRSNLDTWSYYILTADPAFESVFGRASKKRKLFNGNLRVDYYQYFGPRPPKSR